MIGYNIRDWYWVVGGDATHVWSSARARLVPIDDASFMAWCGEDGELRAPSRIVSVDELSAVFAEFYPAGMPATYNTAKRFAIETGGIVVSGAQIDTTRESQSMIANAYSYSVAAEASQVRYKAASGWVTLSAAQIKAVALAVGGHVQRCFAKEDEIDALIKVGTISTIAEIDSAYEALA